MNGANENDDPINAEQPAQEKDNDFLVVGLGASAGGIKAFREFFAQVPARSGMAYVVILHLSPRHDSKLAEILQHVAPIPVTQVRETVKIEPDHVYVIPPNQSLAINNGLLTLSEITQIEERRAPVDIFFRTLAENVRRRAVCVVLSGTGANGSMGLKRIKERGGIALVQDPQEAEYEDMPRNSIATGLVDYVLPAAAMPAQIMAYRRGQLSETASSAAPPETTKIDQRALSEIFAQLRRRTGHDFSNYKGASVLRRIERRMHVNEIAELSAYARFLQEQPDETGALLRDLLISVTNFFRDRDAFAALEQNIIARLFAGKTADDQVRVWVAGCATGEEAYSVAMLLAEQAARVPDAPAIQVFASDIDQRAINIARYGLYTEADIADVSPERLRRFFAKENGGYRVRRELRELMLFAVHNVVKDPPFSHLDMITCRNLFIYLNTKAQEKITEIFHFALRPGGYLFLGGSESISGASGMFLAVEKPHRIFQSRQVAARRTLPMLDYPFDVRVDAPPRNEHVQEARAQERLTALDLHLRLIEQYGPPSIVVNDEYEIIHLSEQAGRYLQMVAGEPSRNLLKLVRPELRLELRTALYQAAQRRTNVEARGLRVKIEERTQTINLLVRPALRPHDPTHGLILVLFEPVPTMVEGELMDAAEPMAPVESATRHLEEELERVTEQLRVTIEQYEVQHEEHKAANEELQAINEELRSATEELETSKEDLQSVNEELTTVNQELKIKIEELSQSNNDFQNLMSSTEIGTIFLDRLLRIKLFTPRARDLFNLIPADMGRPLPHLTSNLRYENLLTDVERVLETLQTIEREVETHDNRWYLLRLLPYRTAEDRIEGVMITFIEVTARRQAEEAVRQSDMRFRASEERLRLVIESATDYAIFTLTTDNLVDSWNPGAERTFGYTEAEIIGQSGAILFTPEDRERGVPEQEIETAAATGRATDERWHIHKDGTRFYCSGVMVPLRAGQLHGFAKIARDLTRQKRAEEELQRAHDELEHRIAERTSELRAANESLSQEVQERRAAEERARALLRQIVTVQEEERRRIALDLHDQLGQQLTALRLNLESHKESCANNEQLRAEVEQLRLIAEQLDADVDYLAWELRPSALDQLGLTTAITNYVQQWSKHSGIAAEFQTVGSARNRLPAKAEINLYRIVQEALNNVVKHAAATQVGVLLEHRAGKVTLIIEDDGSGFVPNEQEIPVQEGRGLGLLGMQERAALVGGTFVLESTPGQGTIIIVAIPNAPAEGK